MKDGIIRNCVNCVDVSSVNTSPPSQRSTTSVSHGSGMVLWNAGTVEHCLNLGSVYVYSKSWYAYGCSIVCYAGWYGSTRCEVNANDCANLGTVTVSSGHTNDGLNNYSWGDSPTMSGLGKYDSMSRNEVLACWADVLNMCPGSVPD